MRSMTAPLTSKCCGCAARSKLTPLNRSTSSPNAVWDIRSAQRSKRSTDRPHSMTVSALDMQESLDAPVSQHRNVGLDTRRAFELVALDLVDFLHRVNRGARFARKRFDFRFSGNG